MSSLAGSSRCGAHDITGAGPRTTSGVTGPTAKALLPRGLTRPSASSDDSARLSQPLSVRRAWRARSRARPGHRNASARDRGSRPRERWSPAAPGRAGEVRHCRIEREERVEQRRRLAVEDERPVAAQPDPAGIADRRDHGEPVERAAQHDDEHARIAASARASLGACAHAKSAPVPSSMSRRVDECRSDMITSVEIPAP